MAYLLTWNPDRWQWDDLAEQIAAVSRGEAQPYQWTTGNRKQVSKGTRFFLLRQGPKPRGIVASGTILTEVYQAEHYDQERAARGDKTNCVDVQFDRIVDAEAMPQAVLGVEDLRRTVPDVDWAPQSGGIELSASTAARIEHLWRRSELPFESGLQLARHLFQQKFPDFETFENPGEGYVTEEDAYKREAIERARQLLQPLVDGDVAAGNDQACRDVVRELFGLTNFVSWRGTQAADELFSEEGAWRNYLDLILMTLRADAKDWDDPLGRLLGWLSGLEATGGLTKVLSSYPLFLWAPERHLFIKPTPIDTFLKLLGEPPTGFGQGLTVEIYERVLAVFKKVGVALSDWSPRDNVDLQSFCWVVSQELARRKPKAPGPKDPGETVLPKDGDVVVVAELFRPDLPHNLILAGPPGTGKTYRFLNEFGPLFTQSSESLSRSEFVFEACRDLTWRDACVVGLALLKGPSMVSDLMGTEPVIAKSKAQGRERNVQNTLWASLQTFTPMDCANVGLKTRREPGLFWKDDDSRWRLTESARESVPELLALAEEIRAYTPRAKVVQRFEVVTFHPSYGYEDFVEGIKPTLGEDGDDTVGYEITPGVFRRLVQRALAEPGNAYALLIDEVNRGNIPNIFGELITLLEEDKRMKYDPATARWKGGMQVKLPYTHASDPGADLFGVPDNLYVIGTMNTADRSIALMDLALRRRFTFEEVMPEPGLLTSKPGPISLDDGREIRLDRMLEAMNHRIEFLLDRDHMIGHSYFMSVNTLSDLERVFRQQVLPLLQEYFYADWEKIQLTLADLVEGASDKDDRYKAHQHAIVGHTVVQPKDVLGVSSGELQPRRLYAISEELSAESFLKIYG